jgi:hypothetical protein
MEVGAVRVPLRVCDESPCIELHLVRGYREAEIVEEEKMKL